MTTAPIVPEPPVDGRFRLESLLGSGGYGEAFRGSDLRTGRPVVVKLLHEKFAESDKVTERFRREVVALEVLRDHPHVVGLVAHGACAARGRPYYAMTWVDGVTLGAVLERERRLPLARALRLVDQLLLALEAAHGLGVVHRDLKPDNVLVEGAGATDEHLQVIDFGLAKHLQGEARTIEDLTGMGALGTPLYMAPELCSGMPAGPAVDVYAVGCLIMELLTGRPPFLSEGSAIELITQHVLAEAPRLDDRLPDAPRGLVDLVSACLDKAPENRPDAATLRRALRGVVDGPTGGAAPTGALGGRSGGGDLDRALTGAVHERPGDSPGATREVDPAPLPPVRLEAGGVLGGYLLEHLLGEGGFGAVFRTRLPDGRPAAIKALLQVPDDPVFQRRARFERELRLLEALRHPAIPTLIAHGEDRGVLWAVIELIEGEDLSQTLTRRGRLPIGEVLGVLRQVLPALDAAHMRGVIHCDLKPENLRVRADGRAFLLDFGIAKLRDASGLSGRSIESLEGSVVGTFEYLPPELAKGRKAVSPMGDVYAMGCVIYHLLTGRPPFDGDSAAAIMKRHVHEAPLPVRVLAPDVPVHVDAVVMQCLAKRPVERPMTAGLLLRALEEALLPPPAEIACALDGGPPTGGLATGSAETGGLAPLSPTAAVAPPVARAVATTLPPDYAVTPPPTQRLSPRPAHGASVAPSGAAPARDPRGDAATLTPRPPADHARAVQPPPAMRPPGDLVRPQPSHQVRRAPAATFAVGVLTGAFAGRKVRLEPAAVAWTVGRDPACQVLLPADATQVSRRHAVIRRTDDGLEVLDPGSATGTRVEGVEVGPDPLPLARGVIVEVGPPGEGVLLVVDEVGALERGTPPDLLLRREDGGGPRVRLDMPRVLGRGPQATPLLDPARDLQASALHCRVAPRLNQLVVEDLDSPNGTWLDGQRVRAAVLRAGMTLGLGGVRGPGVARLCVEAARRPRTSAVLGRSREPLADAGDALRARLDVTLGEQAGRLFLFTGSRLRFGRNRTRDDGTRENDLILRAFPRHPREAASLIKERTRNVSGQHGVLLLTRDGVAVRDTSTLGTKLDGRPLPKGELVPLGETFVLEIADTVGLRGRVYRADVDLDDHPVAAVRLERTRDGEHHTYVWLVREVGLGSGADDAIGLPAALDELDLGVLPGHAQLAVRGERFVLTPAREGARVEVERSGPVGAGVQVALEDGVAVRLGALALRFSSVSDDDMLPQT